METNTVKKTARRDAVPKSVSTTTTGRGGGVGRDGGRTSLSMVAASMSKVVASMARATAAFSTVMSIGALCAARIGEHPLVNTLCQPIQTLRQDPWPPLLLLKLRRYIAAPRILFMLFWSSKARTTFTETCRSSESCIVDKHTYCLFG
jgi:hypothetical protein